MKFLKITSLLLVLVMLFSILPICANALDKLSAPAEVYWSGTTANWTLVDNASGYKVQVYKDGIYQGSTAYYFDITEEDLFSYMEYAGYGYYYFSIVALGDGEYFDDSDSSVFSEVYPYGVEPEEPSSSTLPTEPTSESTVPTESTSETDPNESEYLIGDVDLDGVISIKDTTTIQLYLAYYTTLTDQQLLLADALSDGNINIKDSTYIQMYLAHYIDSLG